MFTTLNKIKQHHPCSSGWEKLLSFLNKTESDDEQLSLIVILESNGLDDALWALRTVEGGDKEIRLIAADFAESTLNIFEKQYPTDTRPRVAIDAARDFANGLITEELLGAAGDAAWDAARDAARAAARAAAWAAAWAAAGAAAGAAARAAAWDAARAAAGAAAWAAARAAAGDAEKQKQIQIFLKYASL